jgi:hypothetical protein
VSDRSAILSALAEEILGPRNGHDEILPDSENPRDEYITGVLAPLLDRVPIDIEGEAAELSDDTDSEDEDDGGDPAGVTAINPASPSLDPKSLPRSIGISFVVEETAPRATFEICATWARYLPEARGGWKRHPKHLLTGSIPLGAAQDFHHDDNVRVSTRVTRSDGLLRISVFLLNSRSPEAERAETQDYIFQPQIRIRLMPEAQLFPVRRVFSADLGEIPGVADDRNLEFLYSERAGLARGHMCGAVWREIDPQRPLGGDHEDVSIPFVWRLELSAAYHGAVHPRAN